MVFIRVTVAGSYTERHDGFSRSIIKQEPVDGMVMRMAGKRFPPRRTLEYILRDGGDGAAAPQPLVAHSLFSC